MQRRVWVCRQLEHGLTPGSVIEVSEIVSSLRPFLTVNVNKTLAPKNLKKGMSMRQKRHTTAGIRWWSPTQLLISRSKACVWQSGRDAQLSLVYGRMLEGGGLFCFI